MIVDVRCNIKNENRAQDDVAHYRSVAVLTFSFGNIFAMNVYTPEQYIPDYTLYFHLGKSSFALGVLMVGSEF